MEYNWVYGQWCGLLGVRLRMCKMCAKCPVLLQVFDWTSSSKPDVVPEVVLDGENSSDLVRTVVVTVQEPDFILVSDIENINSEAIMLNAEFRMNLCQVSDD